MRRIGILLAALGLVLVIGVGLLVMRALKSIEEEERLRHEVVAARLFDEFERELTSILQREEERSFLEYRTLFVPERQVPGNPSLSVSPLAAGPSDPYVVGWYQVEPDGALNLPWRPRPREQELVWATGLDLGNDAPALSDNEQTIELVTQRLLEPVIDEWNLRLEVAAQEQEEAAPKKETVGRRDTPSTSSSNAPDEVSKAPASGEGATAAPTGGEHVNSKDNPDAADRQTLQEAQHAAQRDAEDAPPPQREQAEAVQDAADTRDSEEVEETAAQVAIRSPRPPAPRLPAPKTGRKKKTKPGAPSSSSERAVLESLNRGGSARRRRQTKSSSYSQGNADLFKNDDPVGLMQSEAVPKPTAQERPEFDQALDPEPDEEPEEETEDDREDLADVLVDGDRAAAARTVAQAAAQPTQTPRIREESERAEGEEGEEKTGETQAAEGLALTSTVAAEPTPEPVQEPQYAPDPPARKPRSQPPRRAAGEEPPPPAKLVELLVTVSPFSAYRPDAEHLVLHRDVQIGEDRYVQGLVLQLPALIRELHHQVVGTDIEDAVELVWPDVGIRTGGPVEGRYAFEHTFEEPFESLSAGVTLGMIAREGQDPRSWVVFLAILLGIVGTLGFGGLYRSVAVVVHFSEQRNNFVAAVTHELKTPLTAIRMYGEILRDGLVADEAKKQVYYGIITTESERLGRLINNVLELSNLEKGSRPMRLEVGSIAAVLEEVCRVLGPHARERGLTLVTQVPDDLPPARFDRDALLQVVINLVDNAIKFSAGSEDERILLCAAEGTITIRDHGPGVPSAQLNRIFQPFFRGERELTRTTKGTGIGLALVRGLVEQMGGRVIARNHPSGGFEVSIAL
jgi:signal transduction histidine kinase